MIERALFVLILLAAGMIICRLLTRRQLVHAGSRAAADMLLRDVPPGTPTIVYFTTPDCTPCRLQQTPNLQRLQAELGDRLRVIRVDATQEPEAADRWGVFSVPTVFVLDKNGRPRRVYNGVVDNETLKRELFPAQVMKELA
jgi:thioredoxin-like negative regulator of GroEL